MNERQINCSCGASWLYWENLKDRTILNNSRFEISEACIYICPKCGKSIITIIVFDKKLNVISYPYGKE